MAFKIYTFTPASNVATGGTMAFVLGSAVELGQVSLEGNHVLFAEGLGAQFVFPTDFTVSFSGSTATVTYNGSTTIPAGSVVKLQLETAGENSYLTQPQPLTGRDFLGNIRHVQANMVRVLLGAPIAASGTTVVNAGARTGTNTLTTYASPVVLDVPRVLQYVSGGADTATVTARGLDEFGVAMSEIITLNGNTPVIGKKAFKTVISDQCSTTVANNLSIGVSTAVGMPFFIPGGTSAGMGYFVREVINSTLATAGTAKGGDLTKATTSTGDVRGTYIPNTAFDGARVFELFISGADVTFRGVPQA